MVPKPAFRDTSADKFCLGQASAGAILKPYVIACRFFALPLATKKSAKRSVDNSMGYFNDEFTKQKMDLKEGFDFRHVQVGKGGWVNSATTASSGVTGM